MKKMIWLTIAGFILGLGNLSTVLAQQETPVPAQPAVQVDGQPPAETPKPELNERDRDEVEYGKKIVEQVLKEYKIIDDPALNERVNRIGQILAEIARNTPTEAHWGESGSPPFEYSFKIIDDKDVNAFSIPGGFIFVHKGLLDFVNSDHELAGVLAHEIAHAAHRHVMTLVREDGKVSRQVMLPVLLGALLGRVPANDTMTLLAGTQLYRIAKMNSFGQEAETDSDLTAMEYLKKSPYSPVGLLTFMERLAVEERRKPQIDWGIYRTHPPSKERVAALRKGLQEANIPIRRREISPSLRVVARPESAEDANSVYEVYYDGIQIFKPATDSKQRAEQMASRLNTMLDDGIEMFEVRISNDGTAVLVKGEELARITDSDSVYYGKSPHEITAQIRESIRRLLWSDTVRLLY